VTEVAFPNGVTNSWTRDQAGRVTGWHYEKSGTALVERDFTLMGPQGGVKLQSIWEGNKLITFFVYGGTR
jgi:hypothetical protein